MKKVIFLDIDGVLNNRPWLLANKSVAIIDRMDPIAVARLNKLVELTGASIVVSSSWRLPFIWSDNADGMNALLDRNGVKAVILGMTPHLRGEASRGDEIALWLSTNPVDAFVILDDVNDMGSLADKLVETHMDHGLLDEHVQAAIKILEA